MTTSNQSASTVTTSASLIDIGTKGCTTSIILVIRAQDATHITKLLLLARRCYNNQMQQQQKKTSSSLLTGSLISLCFFHICLLSTSSSFWIVVSLALLMLQKMPALDRSLLVLHHQRLNESVMLDQVGVNITNSLPLPTTTMVITTKTTKKKRKNRTDEGKCGAHFPFILIVDWISILFSPISFQTRARARRDTADNNNGIVATRFHRIKTRVA